MENHVLPALEHFSADFLIVSAGFDTYHRDPVGFFNLQTRDFGKLGRIIGKLKLPSVIIQEGGYYTPHLGENVKTFLLGMRETL